MFYKIIKNDIYLNIFVKPNKKETKILFIEKSRGSKEAYQAHLCVALNCPPIDGKANAELIFFISKITDIAKSKIELVRGEKSRQKLLKMPMNEYIIKILQSII